MVSKGREDEIACSLRKTGASSKYSENFVALRVALAMSRRKSGRNLAISYGRRVKSVINGSRTAFQEKLAHLDETQ